MVSLSVALVLGDGPAGPRPLAGVRRIVFLGDSITYAGGYIEFVEAYLRAKDPALRAEFLDLGLPSETVSGLSEPGHAGGSFPRPDLRERLDRVLERTRPDLVVACYGMNDGIYYPFHTDRSRKFEEGLVHLRARAASVGAKVVHLTPPVFDPAPIRSRTLPDGLAEYRQPFEGYDDVLGRYGAWLVSKRAEGWEVIDVHGPLRRALDDGRRLDPAFRLADDGVHLDARGHWIIARAVLQHWGCRDLPDAPTGDAALATLPHGPEILALIRERQRLLKDPWLTATGHRRPGMPPGLPLDRAQSRAGEIEAAIRASLATKP